MTAADGPVLRQLYGQLSESDLYRRFLTGGLPPSNWFDSWASVGDRDGFGLLVTVSAASCVSTDTGESTATETTQATVVAEAGYALLDSGDGELAIAVAPGARGWLGPWLLDSLLQHAHARGVPNLQALVLSENRPMIALANGRGSATLGASDWSTRRLSMSTKGRVPSWPGDPSGDQPHERPRLLVYSERSRWSGAQEADRRGFEIILCQGPDDRRRGCPLLQGELCPLVSGADVVVNLLDPTCTSTATLRDAQQEIYPRLHLIEGLEPDQSETGHHRRSDADILDEANDLLAHQGAESTPTETIER